MWYTYEKIVKTIPAEKIDKALKAGDWGQAFGSVSPEMIEAFSVCGTPDVCIERITKLLKSGIPNSLWVHR